MSTTASSSNSDIAQAQHLIEAEDENKDFGEKQQINQALIHRHQSQNESHLNDSYKISNSNMTNNLAEA